MKQALDIRTKARAYAFLLLKSRPRSEKEIRDRFKLKKYTHEVIQDTIAFLKAKRFIDDAAFARLWCESRLKKPLGLRKINQELRVKGIDPAIIEQTLAAAQEVMPESETILRLARAKYEKIVHNDPDAAKQRIYALLLRRGFAPEEALDAIDQL